MAGQPTRAPNTPPIALITITILLLTPPLAGCLDTPPSPPNTNDTTATETPNHPTEPTCPGITLNQTPTPQQPYPHITTLTACQPQNNDLYGEAIAASGDLLVIGAPKADLNKTDIVLFPGAVYVYRANTTGWQHETTLTAPDPTTPTGFGSAVDTDGERIIVGAPHWRGGDHWYEGKAYIYTQQDQDWSLETSIHTTRPADDANFASTVAILNETAFIGQHGREEDAPGRVQIHEHNDTNWTHTQTLTSGSQTRMDELGDVIHVTPDRLFLGAPGVRDHEGAVYVFDRGPDGWEQASVIRSPTPQPIARFGSGLYTHQGVLAVGAPLEGEGESSMDRGGRIHLFEEQNGTWTHLETLTGNPPGAGQLFGRHVILDDSILVAGLSSDDSRGYNSGAVSILTKDAHTGWQLDWALYPPYETAERRTMGFTTELVDGAVLVGVPGMRVGSDFPGSVRVYGR